MLALSLLEPLTTCPPPAVSSPFSGYCFREAVSTPVCSESEIAWTVMRRLLDVRHCACCCRWVSKKEGPLSPPFQMREVSLRDLSRVARGDTAAWLMEGWPDSTHRAHLALLSTRPDAGGVRSCLRPRASVLQQVEMTGVGRKH